MRRTFTYTLHKIGLCGPIRDECGGLSSTMTLKSGKWIQSRRTFLKLTRIELADLVVCSADTIKKIENGKRRPSTQIAEALATSLKIRTNDVETFIRFARGESGILMHAPDELVRTSQTAAQGSASIDQIKVLNRLPPTPDQRLFGIDERLARLEPLVMSNSRPWLISIEGIGGIGKTTLAHTLVQRLMDSGRFDDIGWVSAKQEEYVTGKGIRSVYDAPPALDEEALIDALLAQLADGPYPIDNKFAKRAALHELLQKKSCLIVVDNLETVADYDALLPAMRHLARPSKFLITSRMSLEQESDIYAESTSELSKKDTIEFLRHVALEQRNNQLQSAEPAQLEEIYQTVGGNPLALKLVVGQTYFVPLKDVLSSIRLTQSADADQLYLYIYRQAWDMLSKAGRKLLLALPIVPNGTFKQLIISSQLPPFQAHSAINELRTLSLIEIGQGQQQDEPRYRIHRLTETFLMHEVVKWNDDGQESESAEGQFFEDGVVAMVDHWRTSKALSAADLEELDQEKEGMLTAVRLSLSIPSGWVASKALIQALTSYMERRGHWSEWQLILEEGIIAAQKQQDVTGEIELMGMLGRTLQLQGKEEEVIQNYRHVIRRARRANQEIELARACSNLGFALIERVHWWRAEMLCCYALDIFSAHQHEHGLAHTHNHLGLLYARAGNNKLAQKNLNNAITLWQNMGDTTGLINGYLNMSVYYQSTEDNAKAIVWLEKGLKIIAETGEVGSQVRYWINLSNSYIALSQLETAEQYAARAEVLAKQLYNLEATCLAWINLGRIHALKNQWELADQHFEQAMAGLVKLNNKRQQIKLDEVRINLYLMGQKYQEAEQAFLQLKALCQQSPLAQNLRLLSKVEASIQQYR